MVDSKMKNEYEKGADKTTLDTPKEKIKLKRYLLYFVPLVFITGVWLLNRSYTCSTISVNAKNSQSLNTVSTPQQVYVLGDSLAIGFGSNGSNMTDKLSSMLGPLWEVRNRSVGGNTTAQMLARLEKDIFLNQDANAKYVVVWGGTNDVYKSVKPEETENNLQTIYSTIKKAGIKVVAVNVPPSKTSPTWTEDKQTATNEINAWIANKAVDVDYKIDVYTLLENPELKDTMSPLYHGGDYLHLNERGYFVVGEAVYKGANWLP